jgi:hypothetical protein
MMRHALVALGPRTVLPVLLVGGAALALAGVFVPRAEPAPHLYRLVLHAPEGPGFVYLSAWSDGAEVLAAHDASDHRAMVFTRRADEPDGCSWLGTERLVPIGARLYEYTYRETLLACRPDARPYVKTPRAGLVTVERYEGEGTPTALSAVQAPVLPQPVVDPLVDDDVAIEVNRALREAEQAVRDANQQVADALAAAQYAAGDDE